ncbi:mandelate racemase/muconate lactonizing enzyme family protein [Sporolactobacillus vineae]|uniref:mandelate racemase/muconate lactonizing enzyme family protein n=1 Tax=Sporolactobacillus vineae TaxID=444463 RepID=UPI000287FE22|nr:dipeptide epimerase [Sporolactobacillus vineae]
MKIADIRTRMLSIPLNKPFKTALRTVTHLNNILVTVICDDGTTGIGEAPPTHVITGDSLESIRYAVEKVIGPQLIGLQIEQKAKIDAVLERAMVHNVSAKAAIDMAVYDCLGKCTGLPLYQLLGGYRNQLCTDFTVSVNGTDEMIADALELVQKGYDTLKIKVGNSTEQEDLKRVSGIRRAVGPDIKIRLDANQGWSVKEAISAIRKMEHLDLDIELVEQPLPAWDFSGMKQVTESVVTPIMADESVFSLHDAARLLAMHGCDILNIKLMKAGGIANAVRICHIAEAYGIECMCGCMIESKVSVTAACQFAAAERNVTRCDLDAPLMLAADPVEGGVSYQGKRIFLPEQPGLGITAVHADD